MAVFVHELQVEEEMGRQGRQLPEDLRLNMAAGVQDNREIPLFTSMQERSKEVGLEKGLPPREGHSSFGLVEIDPVLLEEVQGLFYASGLPDQLQGPRQAHLNTNTSQPTLIPSHPDAPVFQKQGPVGTGRNTISTDRAPVRTEEKLRPSTLALRVVASQAGKGTSLQE
jgi:hypothetical protein